MRLFCRIEGLTPFCLILPDNLLDKHYEENAKQYFAEQWSSPKRVPQLILIRRVHLRNGDKLFDFKRRSSTIRSIEEQADTGPNVYSNTANPDQIRQEMVVTNPSVPSLGIHCETELLVKSISLERLIMKLSDPLCTPFLENVFWDTYRSFTSPATVLAKLIERYEVPPIAAIGDRDRSPTDVNYYNELVIKIRTRIFQLLEHWVERYYFDFADDALYHTLTRFVQEKIDANGMPAKILMLMKVGDRTALANRKPTVLPGIVSRVLSGSTILAQYSAKEIANQLTLLTIFVHNKIFPSELFGRRWAGSQVVNVPNFVSYRDLVDKVSNWVSYTIVSERDPKVRVHNLAAVLDVCDELHKSNNWDMLVAVYGGISDPVVARLTHTAVQLPEHSMRLLPMFEELLSLKGTSKVLKNAMANSQRPRFPSIVVYLRDLSYLEETPIKTADDMINFLRCIHQYNLAKFLLDGKHQQLDVIGNLELQGAFSKWKIVDENMLQRMSLSLQAS